jgi:hypothetical protein
VNQAQNHTIFSVEQLYHTIQGTGVVEVRDNQGAPEQALVANDHIMEPSAFSDEHSRSNLNHSANPAQSSKPQYLIELKQPVPYSASSGHQKSTEIILYGHGCKSHIVAKIGRNYVHVDETLYYYQINVSVKNGHGYTIYVCKD